jgi:hypothetical protein
VNLRRHATELVLFVLAAGVLIAFLLERGNATDTERRDRDHDVFPAYRRADVDLIELKQGQATVKIERRAAAADGGEVSWHMASPVDETADPAAVDRLVGDLEFAGVIRKVDPSVAGGFDTPRVVGTLSMKPLVYHFALGGAAPTPEGAGYLRVDGEGTFVVSRDFVKALTSPADTYRNRTVVPYLSLDLAHLELDTPGGHFTLDRADDVSFRFADTSVRVSRTALDRVWGALAEVRAETFLKDDDADRALGPAPIRIVMTPKDPKRPSGELLVGGPCPEHAESVVFVRRSPTRASACVPGGVRAGLMTPREELVDRHLFASRADEIEEVILETIPSGTTIELARKGRGWHERKPADRELAGAEAGAANELVTKLTQGEGARIITPAEGPLYVARARARLKRGSSNVEEVVELLSRPGTVRRAFDGAVLEVSPSIAHRLWPSEIALRGASVFPAGFAGHVPVSLQVQCDGTTELATREGRDAKAAWTLSEPHGFAADPLAISDLATLVQNAQADSWIADRDDGELGFNEGSCQVAVTLIGEAGNTRIGIVFGKETDDGAFYAHALDDSAVFLAPRPLREGPDTLLIDRGGFRVDPGAVAQVSLSNGKAKRTLNAEPRRDAGSRDPTSRVLAALETLRPDMVVHLGLPKPGEGFGVPTLDVRIKIRADAGAREIHFVVGDTAMVERHRLTYARIDGVDATFGIAHDRLEPLFDAL